MKSMKLASNIRIENRKARFEYIILDRYTAGIQLFELFIKQMHIAEYRFGSYANHEAKRDRKLLLHRKEIRKLARATQDTGKTIVPLLLYINEKGLAKVEIALCQGKRTYDKRQSLREADDKREVAQAMKAARLK